MPLPPHMYHCIQLQLLILIYFVDRCSMKAKEEFSLRHSSYEYLQYYHNPHHLYTWHHCWWLQRYIVLRYPKLLQIFCPNQSTHYRKVYDQIVHGMPLSLQLGHRIWMQSLLVICSVNHHWMEAMEGYSSQQLLCRFVHIQQYYQKQIVVN